MRCQHWFESPEQVAIQHRIKCRRLQRIAYATYNRARRHQTHTHTHTYTYIHTHTHAHTHTYTHTHTRTAYGLGKGAEYLMGGSSFGNFV